MHKGQVLNATDYLCGTQVALPKAFCAREKCTGHRNFKVVCRIISHDVGLLGAPSTELGIWCLTFIRWEYQEVGVLRDELKQTDNADNIKAPVHHLR